MVVEKSFTDHIRENLNTCTDIIVVMSEATKESWWVPFEIGMATEKRYANSELFS